MSGKRVLRSSGNMIVIIDTREKDPFLFGGTVELRKKALPTGDYSVVGLENRAVVERKSLADLIQCCGKARNRFEDQLNRLRGIQSGVVICEGSWAEIDASAWHSKISKVSVIGSILGWQASGVPIIMAGSRERAERLTFGFLRLAYNRAQYELQGLTRGKPIEAKQAFA